MKLLPSSLDYDAAAERWYLPGAAWRWNDEMTGTRSEESEVVVVALLSSTYYIRDSMPNAGIPKK